MESAATVPAGLKDVTLRDGSTIQLRMATVADGDAIAEMFEALSPESRQKRLLSSGKSVDRDAPWLTTEGGPNHVAVVAVAGDPERIIGHGCIERTRPDTAEAAIAVADDFQSRGVGTMLLEFMAGAALDRGIDFLEADVSADNHQMVDVLIESGYSVGMQAERGLIRIRVCTTLTELGINAIESRERLAAVAAVRSVLEPKSIAVIGASSNESSVGGAILRNVLTSGFVGPVYAINRHAGTIQGLEAYEAIADTPEPPELAVIAVPAASVVSVARECATAGVKALVVISSGFAETGDEGESRQQELRKVCAASGMRMVGPNCFGVINTADSVRLNATFGPEPAKPGRVGFATQSGALGLAVLNYAQRLDLGLSSFVSLGNRSDISNDDLLQYWGADDGTDVVMLYLESFGNPRKFSRIARRVARAKPVIAVKSGRSAAGMRAAASHTGALVGGSDALADDLFREAGVVRVTTISEMFDVAGLFAHAPLPAGNRVAIVTNAGGPGILCADNCEAEGLDVAPLPAAVVNRIGGYLPGEAALSNPVDMTALAPVDDFRRTILEIARAGAADAIIAIYIPPLLDGSDEYRAAIESAVRECDPAIPLLSVLISASASDEHVGAGESAPLFQFPENAVRALSAAVRYSAWLRDSDSDTDSVDRHLEGIDASRAAALLADSDSSDPAGWLKPSKVMELLDSYGISQAKYAVCDDPASAADAAAKIGGPVALKAVAAGLIHKSEAGAVRVDLTGKAEVLEAAKKMAEDVRAAGFEPETFIVQEMAAGGVEMLAGVLNDPVFGPVIACGAGGTTAELIGDVSVAIAPVSRRTAREAIASLRTYPLLTGYRGAEPADAEALADVVVRLGAMSVNHPEIAELDCNPVVVTTDRAIVVDARVRIEVRQ